VEPIRRDPAAWPSSYRAGVAAGLLLDEAGRLSLRSRYVEDLAAIVAAMDAAEWRELAGQAAAAMWTADLARDPERRQELVDLIDAMKPTVDESRRAGWVRLAEAIGAG
jgi:hypothetical protein